MDVDPRLESEVQEDCLTVGFLGFMGFPALFHSALGLIPATAFLVAGLFFSRRITMAIQVVLQWHPQSIDEIKHASKDVMVWLALIAVALYGIVAGIRTEAPDAARFCIGETAATLFLVVTMWKFVRVLDIGALTRNRIMIATVALGFVFVVAIWTGRFAATNFV